MTNLPNHPSRSFPYEIKDKIGQGAMGSVFLANETNLDRKVAIKTLRPDFLKGLSEKAAKDASRRFLQEARAIAQLSHRGIVSVYRLGTENGTAFIVMEWLEGESLEAVLEQEGAMEFERAGRLIMELLEIVHSAHLHGIIHRDIKPANVMVQPDGHLKLADFGIAHVKGSELIQTQAGSMIGTPLYAPPEQLSGHSIDGRADLYSIGVLFYQMLTGEVPFSDTNVVRLVQTILSEKPPSVRSKNPMIPPAIEAFVETALGKKPADRFSTAEDMARALKECLPHLGEISSMGSSSVDNAATLSGSASTVIPADLISVAGNTPVEIVGQVVTGWEPTALGQLVPERLLERLMEAPLHADPFSGAAQLGDSLFLVSQGLIYGAISLQSGQTGDVVYEQLPDEAQATLYPLPKHLDGRLVISLSSLLHTSERLHHGLDTSITDMVKLYAQLCADKFDGAIRIEDEDRLAYLLVYQGEPLLDIFSQDWKPSPLSQGWQSWIGQHSFRVHVEKRRAILSRVTYQRELKDLCVSVSKSGSPAEGGTEKQFEVTPACLDERTSRASTVWQDIYDTDIGFNLMGWLHFELPTFLRERGRFDAWKYLAGWIELVDRAFLYHHLERPKKREKDLFDLVTFDENDKVLHVARKVVGGTVGQLNGFIDDVEAAKMARMKTGDIGGAILVADSFDDETVNAYRERIEEQKSSSWLFSMQNSMTGYEGFVRMGTRRGFHLLLVRRTAEGEFEPVLPPKK